MTAEIFLASTLGCLVAIIVICVFFRTVYMPVQNWLLRRAFRQPLGDPGDLVSVGADYVPCPLESPEELASSQRQYEAQQALSLAAIDVADDLRTDNGRSADRVVAAAQAFRRATTPGRRKQMRAMEAFRKAQHGPDDPV